MRLGIGAPSIFMIFVILVMCVLAILSYLRANSYYESSVRQANITSQYYESESRLLTKYYQLDSQNLEYSLENLQIEYQKEDDLIVPLAYLNTKLKANDSDDSTKIVEIDNTQCLEIKTAKTVTYIYCQDGYLKELYTSNDYHAGLQEGSKLFALDDFKIEQKDRLFKFTVTRDQVSKSISIYLHG